MSTRTKLPRASAVDALLRRLTQPLLRVLFALADLGEGTAQEVARKLQGQSLGAVRHHLGELVACGLVVFREEPGEHPDVLVRVYEGTPEARRWVAASVGLIREGNTSV